MLKVIKTYSRENVQTKKVFFLGILLYVSSKEPAYPDAQY